MPEKGIYLELVVDDKGSLVVKNFDKAYGDAMKRVKSSTTSASSICSRAFSSIGSAMGGVQGRLTSIFKAFTSLKALLVSGIGIYLVKREVEEWIRLSNEQEKSLAGMKQALIAMNRYTPEFAQSLIDISKAYQKVTTFGDEAIQQGIKFLLTYKQISDEELPRATKLMTDIAALMGGDMKMAANMVGKASMGLAGELRRVGITIDEDIAHGGDFVKIMKEIEAQVGGQAGALRRTGYGGLVALGNAIDDAKEKMGDMVKNVIFPFVQEMLKGADDINTALEEFTKGDEYEQRIIRMQMKTRDFAITALEMTLTVKQYMQELVDWIEENKVIAEFGIVGWFIRGKKGLAYGVGAGYLWEIAGDLETMIKKAMPDAVDKGIDEVDKSLISGLEKLKNRFVDWWKEASEPIESSGKRIGEVAGSEMGEKTKDSFEQAIESMIERLRGMKFGLPEPAGNAGASAGKAAGEEFVSAFDEELEKGTADWIDTIANLERQLTLDLMDEKERRLAIIEEEYAKRTQIIEASFKDAEWIEEQLTRLEELRLKEITKVNEDIGKSHKETTKKIGTLWEELADVFETQFTAEVIDELENLEDAAEMIWERMKYKFVEIIGDMLAEWIKGLGSMKGEVSLTTEAAHAAGIQGPGLESGMFSDSVGIFSNAVNIFKGVTQSFGGAGIAAIILAVGRALVSAFVSPESGMAGKSGFGGYTQGFKEGWEEYGKKMGPAGWMPAAVGATMGFLGFHPFGAGERAHEMRTIERVKEYYEEIDKLMKTEYPNLQEMVEDFDAITSHHHIEALEEMGHVTEYEAAALHGMAEQASMLSGIVNKLGGESVLAAGQLDVMTHQSEILFNIMKYESPEAAEKVAQLQNKLRGLWKKDILESFQMGGISLRNLREQLQDMGMEDAETQAQILNMAYDQLFNYTIPLGEVQLKRLYEDIDKLQDEMKAASDRTEGMNVLMIALANGLRLTGEQLRALRENADNLAKVKWVNVYDALGIEQIVLSGKKIESFEDSIEQMRETLNKTSVAVDQFGAMIDKIPPQLEEMKQALIAVHLAMTFMVNLTSELIDVYENLGKIGDAMEGLREAWEAGDVGAIADSITEINLMIVDLIEVVTMLQQAMEQLNFSKMAAGLEGLNKILMGLSGIAQFITLFITIGQILSAFLKGVVELGDAFAESREKAEEWEGFKQTLYDNVIEPLLALLKLLGPLGEWLYNIFSGKWREILGLDDAEDSILYVEDLIKSLEAISEQAFMQMTVNYAKFLENMRKTSFELELQDMQDEFESYIQYIADHWDELVEMFDGDVTQVEKLVENAVDAYMEQIERAFEAFVEKFRDFQKQLQRDIQGLMPEGRTAEDVTADIAETQQKMADAWFEGDWDKWLDNAKDMRDLILERYEIERAEIEKTYGEQIRNMEELRDAWKSTYETINQQILRLETTTASPADIYERLEAQREEVERIRALYEAAEGPERARYAADLAAALGDYLSLAGEAFTRPSIEYQDIFESVVNELKALREEAETQVSFAESEIIRLEEEMNEKLDQLREETIAQLEKLNDLTDNVVAEIEKTKDDYIKNIYDILLILSQRTDHQPSIDSGIASIGIELHNSYLKFISMNQLLKDIESNTQKWWKPPQHHQGLSRVPYTGYVAELQEGERIVTKGESAGSINLSISVDVKGDGGSVSGKRIAKELIHEVEWGDLGKAIQKKVRKVA